MRRSDTVIREPPDDNLHRLHDEAPYYRGQHVY